MGQKGAMQNGAKEELIKLVHFIKVRENILIVHTIIFLVRKRTIIFQILVQIRIKISADTYQN